MPSFVFWIVAFLEGFSTLAVEVISIRLAVPVVGSSMALTGVMLGVVLFALSAGYWRGGALSAGWTREQTSRALVRNLLIAAIWYGVMAFPFEARALETFLDWNVPLSASIGGMGVLLYFTPIYFASQTVPMLAELTNTDGHAGRASGRVLFFSTVGSVAGGIVTPVLLFPTIGVSRTSLVVCVILAIAALVPAFRLKAATAAVVGLGAAGFLLLGGGAAGSSARSRTLYSFDSEYQNISVVENTTVSGRVERVMMVSGGRSSGLWTDTGETSFAYAKRVNAAIRESGARTLLVIGAAGFNVPRDAAADRDGRVEAIDAIDLDPAVYPIAQQYFLQAPLPERVRFLPLSARYAARKLRRDGRRYGFTLVDAYFGRGVPEELTTVEFFGDVRAISDRVAMNLIVDRDLESAFAVGILESFREGAGAVWITDVAPGDSYLANLLITNFPLPGAEAWKAPANADAYRDNRNSAGHDFIAMKW